MTFPRDSRFWSAEQRALWDAMGPVTMSILLRGADDGVGALPAGVDVLVDWDLFNQHAIDYLHKYRIGTVAGIAETTRLQIIGAIDEWIQSGEAMPALEARLGMLLDDGHRARQIAVTEVTRTYAEGNIQAWQSTGVVGGKRWNTARDELVCPICAPLDGMIVELTSNGFTTEVGGLGITAPPAHPLCRCWLTPIVDDGLLAAELERIA